MKIYNIVFSDNNQFLASSSDKGTIHIFSINEKKNKILLVFGLLKMNQVLLKLGLKKVIQCVAFVMKIVFF